MKQADDELKYSYQQLEVSFSGLDNLLNDSPETPQSKEKLAYVQSESATHTLANESFALRSTVRKSPNLDLEST